MVAGQIAHPCLSIDQAQQEIIEVFRVRTHNQNATMAAMCTAAR